jgi:hypothetical protein
MFALIIPIVIVLLALLGSSVRLVRQYEQGVVLRFGRLLPGLRQPVLRLIQASTKLAEAAHVLGHTPDALQLRLPQTVVDVAAEKNSALVVPFPVELPRFFDRAAGADTGATDVHNGHVVRPDVEFLPSVPALVQEQA